MHLVTLTSGSILQHSDALFHAQILLFRSTKRGTLVCHSSMRQRPNTSCGHQRMAGTVLLPRALSNCASASPRLANET